MSAKSRAKRAAKARASMLDKLTLTDRQAEAEAEAIDKAYRSKTIDFGKRLNKYYWCDGERFNTGKRHRRNAVGMTHVEYGERRKLRASKQSDLLSKNVHRRVIVGKIAYRTESLRRAANLVYYAARLQTPVTEH